MRNVLIGVIVGVWLSVYSSAILARSGIVDTAPDAVTADPKHYSLSFENDIVRVLRVTYGPGEKSVMHRHSASCVIFLTDQDFNFTLPDGETAPASVPAGSLGCGDGNIHLPENIGKQDAEFIMVEFKNRQTFQN